MDGADASHKAGTVAYQGFAVLVTDGVKPVSNAIVTFQLPDNEPSGVFPSGQRTETTQTDGTGKATVWGIRWGPAGGTVALSIIARVGPVSAGTMVAVQLLGGAGTPASPSGGAARPSGAGAPPGGAASFEVNAPPRPATVFPAEPERGAVGESSALETPRGTKPLIRPAVVLSTNVQRAERIPSGRNNKLLVGLAVAGAVAGGILAYRMTQPGVSTTPATPGVTLVLSNPVITVGKP